MMKKRMVLTLVLFYSVITFSQVKSGIYRAILFRQDGNQVVFNFEWRREGKKNVIHVLNASERIRVDNIVVKGDSVFIEMPVFEAKVHAAVQKDGSWKGSFVKGTRAIDQSLPFAAYPNQSYRFKADNGNANFNISGRWAVNFADTNFTKNEYAVADFKQIGNRLTGTFLTALGDYRYLEGIVSGNKLYLSCFDGAHNFLFTGYIKNNNTIENGQFCSSGVAKEYWTAKKDDNAALPILEKPVTLLPGETKIDFSFKDVDGKTVSYSDARFNNKVVIVQIMGSWCPNCMDETNFLSEFYRKNKHRGVEVVALAYEYSTDFSRSQKSVLKFQKRFNVQYPMLITGVSVSDEQRTEKTLPQITPIRTFPTTLVVDKKGNVRVIHNTFFGPGTGDVYTKFVEGFNKTVDGLLAE
ncbi:MAG TPA: TlpA disulfide reductase family protein [Chitinophagaceae bacterium]|nr:TlpA disulfide reductase family protein [Chitinophagaceae bacterium]